LIFSVVEVIFLPVEIVIKVPSGVMSRLKKKKIDHCKSDLLREALLLVSYSYYYDFPER